MIQNPQFQMKKLTEAKIVSTVVYHMRAMLLGRAGKALKKEQPNLEEKKTI